MRPAEFKQEQIIEAGKELQDAGRNITGFALRQKIGGGNPARLKQVWDEFISSSQAANKEPVAELPLEVAQQLDAVTKALTDQLAHLTIQLNDQAVKAAEQRVAEVIRQAQEHREQAARELADAAEAIEELENTINEHKQTSAALQQRFNDLQDKYQAQAVELAHVQERLLQSSRAGKMIAQDHITAETALTKAREETNQSRQEAAKLRGQVEMLQAQTSELMRSFAARVNPPEPGGSSR